MEESGGACEGTCYEGLEGGVRGEGKRGRERLKVTRVTGMDGDKEVGEEVGEDSVIVKEKGKVCGSENCYYAFPLAAVGGKKRREKINGGWRSLDTHVKDRYTRKLLELLINTR